MVEYAGENYGIDKICDYIASIETNTKLIRNPARDQENAAVRDAEKTLAAAERELAGLLADPAIIPAAKNARIPALQKKITRARTTLAAATAARKPIPAKLPASTIDPDAKTALLRAGRRGLQMVLRRSPTTPSTGFRATSTPTSATTTRPSHHPQTIIRGLESTITSTPAAMTVTLERSGAPASPGPWPAHRGEPRHPARHARRQPPHHLPPRPRARPAFGCGGCFSCLLLLLSFPGCCSGGVSGPGLR